jgi:hypothetical protein
MPRYREIAPPLVSLGLGDFDAARQAATSLDERDLWRDALGLANAWHILPQLCRRIAQLQIGLAESIRLEVQKATVVSTAQSALFAKRGAAALDHLNRSGISALAFKGMGLIGNLYSSPSERMLSDIDILIQESNMPHACQVLEALGYLSVFPLSLKDWMDYLAEQCDQSTAFIVLASEEGIQLDLHWRIGATFSQLMRADEILARAQPVRLYGVQVPVAAPPDAVALTAFHAWRTMFAPKSTVKDLYDLQRWLESREDESFLDQLVEHALDCRMGVPLLGLINILSDLNSQPRAKYGQRRLTDSLTPKEQLAADRLTRLFRFQLLEGGVNMDVFALFDPIKSLRYWIHRFRKRKQYDDMILVAKTEFGYEYKPLRQRLKQLTHELTDLHKLSLTWNSWQERKGWQK